ncbi:MAG: hypothetical protein LUG50_10845 [Planctomycetaceae bacterium]|nr:hypothetical protein [Planctomycetaceae bacterium]
MRKILLFAAVAVTLTVSFGRSHAAEAKAQRLCPVTGTALSGVASPVRARVDGFTFLVADEASRQQAEADGAAVFAALARNGDAAEPVSEACPIMGNRINRQLFLEKNGRRVFMCCKGCTKRLQNNWDKAVDTLRDQAETGDPETLPEM